MNIEETIKNMNKDVKTFERTLNKILTKNGYETINVDELPFYDYEDIVEMSSYYGAKEYAQIYFNVKY